MTNLTVNTALAVPANYPNTAAFDVVAMRHKTFDPASLGTINAVEIISQPSIGRAVLQDDNTIVINLDGSGQITGSTSFVYRVAQGATTTDCTLDVSILQANQLLGWGDQLHSLLPVDPTTGKWTITKGEDHKDWFVDSVAGLTRSDIATAAGVSFNTVTGNWLIDQWPTYGGSEATAINTDAVFEVNRKLPTRSHQTYHFKRGGDYTSLDDDHGNIGKSAIYRSTITDYGTGARPIVSSSGRTFGQGGFSLHENLDFNGGTYTTVQAGSMIALNKCVIGSELNVQGSEFYVLSNCKVIDVLKKSPSNSGVDWSDVFGDRKSGIFLADSPNSLLMNNYFDRCGWGPDFTLEQTYDPLLNGTDQPPSQFSHNVYIQGDAFSISTWGNISTRAASQGIQGRNVGSVYENVTISNPIGGNNLGKGDPSKTNGNGNYTFALGFVNTQGFGHDPLPPQAGGQNWGIAWAGRETALVNGISIHHNDPNDPTDTTSPDDFGLRRNYNAIEAGGSGEFYDGSTWLVYNWGEPDGASDGVIPDSSQDIVPAIADTYTVQRFTDGLLSRALGTTTGIDDFCAHLRGLEDYRTIGVDLVDYFNDGMIAAGQSDLVARTTRTAPQTVKAVLDPQGRTSGKWWYASFDWDLDYGDYAGRVAGDSANLQGHRFDATVPTEITLVDLMLGDGGGLRVGGSRINVSGTLSGTDATIDTTASGILTFNGYNGAGKINAAVVGGLLANTGTIAGNIDVTVGGQSFTNVGQFYNEGYALLATSGESITFGPSDVFEVKGYGEAVFDGPAGTATLNFNAASLLKFTVETNGHANNPPRFGIVKNKQTGMFGAVAPAITSVVNLNNVPVEIDATGMAPGTYTVLDVDQLNGNLGTVTGGTISKVGNRLEIIV